MSIQDLQQNPQDVSNFYLANIYQATISPSGSNISSSLPVSPPPFSPPTYAVWVNALWFMSLVISLTCAFLAILLQQWARRYLKVTHSRLSPDKRAHIRAFFAEGVEKSLLPVAVEILPALLHISLFLFFTGLVVFLSNVNLTIFKLVLSWVGVCVALYGCVTVMPIFRHDSPYYTSLSSLVWPIVTGFAFVPSFVGALLLYQVVRWRRGGKWLADFAVRCPDMLSQGMQKTVEEAALERSSEIVNRAFMWTFDSLDEDHELERFFSGLPGFCSSKVVDDPLPGLTEIERWKLHNALSGLLDRTFASALLSAPVKQRRAIICAKAANPHLPDAFGVLTVILYNYHFTGPVASEIVQILAGRGNNIDDGNLDSQVVIYKLITNVQLHDDFWFILVSNTLGVREAVLRDYAAHGDSLSLAILIHATRQQFTQFGKSSWPEDAFSFILKAASQFDVQDTSPELRNEFCALWNQIVRKAQNDNKHWMAFTTLGPIRNVYIALHQHTDSAPTRFSASTDDEDFILRRSSSYPVCTIPGHHVDSTAHIHDDNAPTTSVRTAPHGHDNIALVPSLPSRSPDTTYVSAHAPLRVDESTTEVPPLDNSVSPALTTPASHCVPSTSPNPVTTLVILEDIDALPGAMEVSTPELSASPPLSKSKSSTCPPDVVAVEHVAVSHTASGDLNAPSSAPHAPVLDDILLTGLLLPSDSAVTGSDRAFLSLESDLSKLAPTPRGPSPSLLSSAPDRDAIAEEEAGTKAVLRNEHEEDVPHSFSAIHEGTMATANISSRSPSPQPIADVAIAASLPRRSLDAERTCEPSPHGQYDIV